MRTVVASVCILTLLCVGGVAVLASGSPAGGSGAYEEEWLTAQAGDSAEAAHGGDKEKLARMNEKWNSLTAAQKAEIYALIERMGDVRSEIIDKYAEFGIIDDPTALAMKDRLAKAQAKIRENGKMPGLMGGRCKGGKSKAPAE